MSVEHTAGRVVGAFDEALVAAYIQRLIRELPGLPVDSAARDLETTEYILLRVDESLDSVGDGRLLCFGLKGPIESVEWFEVREGLKPGDLGADIPPGTGLGWYSEDPSHR